MNQIQTVERLRKMRLSAMALMHQQFTQSSKSLELTPDEYLTLLTDHQWEDRVNRKMQNLIKQAGFRQRASIMDVDFSPERHLDKNMFMRLSTLDLIKRNENLIITGAAGTGKSYLAQALGHQACIMEYKTLYRVTAKLLNELRLSKMDGTYLASLKKIIKVDLLIIDDFGLQALDATTREILLDIIDERYSSGTTIITSQVPVSAWHGLIGEGTLADAILDRIVNSAHRINLQGESLRKNKINTNYNQ